ncbi:xanthine dehydrogenase [Aminobacter sp. Y103A]|uniref:FAD binding domain-containing protein n=1 Tax=unclassified Aminobacter TaxID=2644704 RepID=UPI0013129F52|nr:MULTISPECIES: xanthine dehydrogenase family protein subunit M [unclassified Aminobacter]MRX34516.1 xanthine dehydrogenase family protein subunit M [Aminobacter sp. MDW-2]QNH34879.1 xanthine dehydrogenase family protein subunit M [Aminobacter sp. MDW-2]BBD35463.1 xanthine dehydrogenase [Aminobacter sp. SS-2016]
MTRYAKPKSLDEALALLSEGSWRVLAGATDVYPALGNRPLYFDVIDINDIGALRGITESDNHFVIGARTSWTEIIQAPLPPAFDALKQAAREIGSIQIQHVASIAGNICNASPAADGVPALMILDAEVELRSRHEMRILPLGAFIIGNRRTKLREDELVTALRIPKASTGGGSAFVKLGARRYLVISIAMAAARVVLGTDARIASAAISVGSCSAVARRLHALEAALVGHRPEVAEAAVQAAGLDELSPIDDVRGSAGYRRSAAREIVARALLLATHGSQRRTAA